MNSLSKNICGIPSCTVHIYIYIYTPHIHAHNLTTPKTHGQVRNEKEVKFICKNLVAICYSLRATPASQLTPLPLYPTRVSGVFTWVCAN